MRILNFGSLNIDKVYAVPHFVRPGETISSTNLELFPGGKGLNQSIALARAGAPVYHAGKVGGDGDFLINTMKDSGVDTSLISREEATDTGQAIIQVDDNGQNSIILYGGANRAITTRDVDKVLDTFSVGEYLLLQNEISCLDYIVDKAFEKGMVIVLNPAPMDEAIHRLDLSKISWLILNEVEGAGLSGETEPQIICDELLRRLPKTKLVLTLGKDGAWYAESGTMIKRAIFDLPVVDTTAAGDTFIGYFLSAVMDNKSPSYALDVASMASGIAVGKKGAAPSIPVLSDVLRMLNA